MSRRLLVLLVLLGTVLAACGSADGDAGAGPREWRDLDLVVPTGWVVLIERGDLLQIANEDISIDGLDERPVLPEDRNSSDVVAVQMSADDSLGPDDWRALVAQQGGDLEQDVRIEVGGLPATSLTYRWVTNDVPTRERVVFVPSRGLYLLFHPVTIQGQTNGPEVYLQHTDEFDRILESIAFGRPVGT